MIIFPRRTSGGCQGRHHLGRSGECPGRSGGCGPGRAAGAGGAIRRPAGGKSFRTVPAYNKQKFHPRAKVGWDMQRSSAVASTISPGIQTPRRRLEPSGVTWRCCPSAAPTLWTPRRRIWPSIRPGWSSPTHYSHAAAARQFRQLLEGGSPLSNFTGKPVTESFH